MQKRLLTNGNIFKRTDNRWGGVVWYMNELGERKRKSFSGTTKAEVNKKITKYISKFNKEISENNESNKSLKDSMYNYLKVFKYPSVERVSYDRLEQLLNNEIAPYIGEKIISDITAIDIKTLINTLTEKGYAFSTVKKIYNLLNEYFRYLEQEEILFKNPMRSVGVIKKANFYANQGKEVLPASETITIFTPEEIERFKKECFKTWGTGKPFYQQSAAYILMLNTGLRTAEMLGLHNSDIDLENKVMRIQRGVKEVGKRIGSEKQPGREIAVGKLKTASSRRIVPLNSTAIEMIKKLREEFYFGEDSPVVCDENGNYTKPSNFRKRFYRILEGAKIEKKGLHSLRHTFATNLVNGVKQPDGTIKSLTPRQVADLLGHSTSDITEMYYVKRNDDLLNGITNGFEI